MTIKVTDGLREMPATVVDLKNKFSAEVGTALRKEVVKTRHYKATCIILPMAPKISARQKNVVNRERYVYRQTQTQSVKGAKKVATSTRHY